MAITIAHPKCIMVVISFWVPKVHQVYVYKGSCFLFFLHTYIGMVQATPSRLR